MGLRVAINARRLDGPYGGVNQFSNNLENHLRAGGHVVFRHLAPGLDIILIVSSKTNSVTTSFSPEQAGDYLLVNPRASIVQRVNTCNEQRAADHGLNQRILEVNRLADHTVFVSDFIRKLYAGQGFDPGRPHSVILTGVDSRVFHPGGKSRWTPGSRMKVVTHHWSNNYMKGFDCYERFDLMLDKSPFKDMFEFVFIGNIPLGFSFRNARVIPPLSGEALGDELRQCHLYLTGTRHEPGGNHYIEAMLCGLPVVYLESGSTGEYCSKYGGIAFTPVDFEDAMIRAYDRYSVSSQEVLDCPYAVEWMGAQYEELFLALADDSSGKSGKRQRLKYLAKKAVAFGGGLKSRVARRIVD